MGERSRTLGYRLSVARDKWSFFMTEPEIRREKTKIQKKMTLLTRRSLLKLIPALPLVGWTNRLAVQPKLRFIVASDGHYGQPGTPFEQYHKDLVSWVNLEKTQRGLDFIIFNGDLIHDDPTLLFDFKKSLASLQVPYYVVRGNHDRVAQDVWKSTWGYGTNHTFIRDDYAFVIADTSNEQGKYLCPDTAWLQAEFSRNADKKGIFVFMHITPAKWTVHGVDCPEIRKLLADTANVKAIFHGHDHNEDGGKTDGGKPYFFDGHFGGSWGTTYKGYRVVEVSGDGSWKTYQYNASAEPELNTFEGKA